MPFPSRRYESAAAYIADYASALTAAHASIDGAQLDAAAAILSAAHTADATIFTCGNGGSASIANHMVCDHQKGVSNDTALRPRVVSLSCNVELLTATTNDVGFAEAFALPLSLHARKGDVLVAISSSGDSENIVRALTVARELGLKSIALTGFNGGRARNMADIALHVDAANYGILEDAHQTIMHALAQFLRQRSMPAELLGKRRF